MAGPAFLFVYGTLRGGSTHPMALRLQAACPWVCRARWRGALWDLGAYPAAVALDAAQEGWVVGDLYRLAGDDVIAEMDAYEGCGALGVLDETGFVREAHGVERGAGDMVRAWLYRYALPLPAGAERVPGGDYAPHLRARQA